MRSLDDFHRTVQNTLAGKRLGTPVFARYLLQGPVAAKAVPHFLAQILRTVSSWLGQELHRVYALGSVKGRHVTLTLEYQGGASGQVTWAGNPGQGVDLMLVGNQGALYHDAATQPGEPFPSLPLEPAPKNLVAWIERALRTNQPELAGK